MADGSDDAPAPLGVEPTTGAASDERLVSARFLIVTAATFCYFIALGSLLPVLPRYIEDELGGDGAAVGIGLGAFAVSAALVRPWVGRQGDRRGRRVLIVGGAALVAVSVAAYSLATSLAVLVVLRLVTGLGEAAVFVGAATAVQDMAPDDRRGEAADPEPSPLEGSGEAPPRRGCRSGLRWTGSRPTGGAGVALPAGSCSVSTARTFFATFGLLAC